MVVVRWGYGYGVCSVAFSPGGGPTVGVSLELLTWGQGWLLPWGTGLGCLLTVGGARASGPGSWVSALGSLWWTVPLAMRRHSFWLFLPLTLWRAS